MKVRTQLLYPIVIYPLRYFLALTAKNWFV